MVTSRCKDHCRTKTVMMHDANHREPLQSGKGAVCGPRATGCRPLPYMYVKWLPVPVCTNRKGIYSALLFEVSSHSP